MKVTSVSSPQAIQQPQSGPSLRDKAMSAFNDPGKVAAVKQALSGNPTTAPAQSQAQEIPPINPNQVSAEEMSAINIPAPQIEEAAQAETTQEAPVEPKKEIDPKLSKQFAQLSRQAKILRQQQQQLELQKADLKAKEAALTSSKPSTDGYISIEELKRNPLGTLTKAQVTYDELTQQLLNSGNPDPRIDALINQQAERIALLEAKIDEGTKQQVKAQDDARNAAIKQISFDVKSLIKNDPNFETIRSTNSMRDVVELIVQTYDKDGTVLSVEEAANEVENYLVDEAMKLTRIGKIKSKLSQAVQPAQPKKTANQQTQPMKTLTNAHSSSRQLSARERAILAFKNELK